ncbi:MAG: ribosome assembly RNA-binding protein YhbY [Lachnospiraceae bacterium]|nr:ribosome assembly RNA-binding protein YhbY [Lachnospiraceae bacterium]
MTSKQRAYLKSLSSTMEPVVHVGKSGASPEVVNSVEEALAARELIKISVIKNCIAEPSEVAEVISERTHSEIVHVIGRKIVLYRPDPDKKGIRI